MVSSACHGCPHSVVQLQQGQLLDGYGAFWKGWESLNILAPVVVKSVKKLLLISVGVGSVLKTFDLG